MLMKVLLRFVISLHSEFFTTCYEDVVPQSTAVGPKYKRPSRYTVMIRIILLAKVTLIMPSLYN